jgi:hypothetical protein
VLLVAGAFLGCADLVQASAFEPAQVIQMLKREIAVADAPAESGTLRLRVEEAILDLDLVEIKGKAGNRLLVPGADFGAGKDEAEKAALRRRLVIDLASARETKTADVLAVAADTSAGGPAGSLARVLAELRSGLSSAVEAPPGWDLKRIAVELEFTLERDAKGVPLLAVFAAGRLIDVKNVQKLKLRLATREK